MLFHKQIASFIEINNSQTAAADSKAVLQHWLVTTAKSEN